MITSPHNPKLKDLRRLRRAARDGRFVAEGEDLLAAARGGGLAGAGALRRGGQRAWTATEVEPEVLARVSALGSGTRALGVYERALVARRSARCCVCLWGVGDPGNVGTIAARARWPSARSASRSGPDCADPFGPKAVRA